MPQDIGETNVAKFLSYVNKKHSLSLKTYGELHQWSVDPLTLQDFWRDAYIFLKLAPEGSDTVGPMMDSRVSCDKEIEVLSNNPRCNVNSDVLYRKTPVFSRLPRSFPAIN